MYALIDCNNFFASCEEVFNPVFRNKPVAILSNNDGCIIARSKNAKLLGVKMGDPAFVYKNRKDIILLSSNFSLYSDMSRRVMETLATCSSSLEIYSIDEAFVNLEIDPKTIRDKVKKWTGIEVSIGIGKTKTQAKLASEFAKSATDGLFYFHEKILETTPVEKIWGIGKNNTIRLHRLSIFTAHQFVHYPQDLLQKHLGINGIKIALELKGVSSFPLEENPENQKSITYSRTFGQTISCSKILAEALAHFTVKAAEKLRKLQKCTSFLSIYVYTTGYETLSASATIAVPTSNTPTLIQYAKTCLTKALNTPNTQVQEFKKAGIILTDFVEESAIPLDLFAEKPSTKKQNAMKVVDNINQKYNKSSIHFAAEGIKKDWKSNQSQVSPKYTTSWDGLIQVN